MAETVKKYRDAVWDLEIVRSWEECGVKNIRGATQEQYRQMGIGCGVVGVGDIDDPFNWQYEFILCVDPETIQLDGRGNVTAFVRKTSNVQRIGLMLSSAETVHGFNSIEFDDEVLAANGYKPNWSRHIDLNKKVIKARRQLRKQRGHEGIDRHGSLNLLAQHTLGLQKEGDGLGAVALLREGKIVPLSKYNIGDCRLNVYLEAFVRRYGFILDDYGLIPMALEGGAPAWEFPGRWFREVGKTPSKTKPITSEQIRKITEGKSGKHGPLSGPHWKEPRCLTMVEASALIDALMDWRKLEREANVKM